VVVGLKGRPHLRNTVEEKTREGGVGKIYMYLCEGTQERNVQHFCQQDKADKV